MIPSPQSACLHPNRRFASGAGTRLAPASPSTGCGRDPPFPRNSGPWPRVTRGSASVKRESTGRGRRRWRAAWGDVSAGRWGSPVRAGHRLAVRDVHAELPDEAKEIGSLEPEGACGARAVPPELEQRGLDEAPLELRHRAVEAGPLPGRVRRRRWKRRPYAELRTHANERWQGACHRPRCREFAEMATRRAAKCTAPCAVREAGCPRDRALNPAPGSGQARGDPCVRVPAMERATGVALRPWWRA
jgi:hypothetical protein